ncbi:MAG TPA: DUF11 domain-containing protein, partial [Actinomycetota bacterium]|nr:DUF11 domain-containing protein [Actinomycetota bacterium]
AVSGTSLFETNDGQNWAAIGPNPSQQGRIPMFETNARSGNGGRDFDLWFGDVSLHRRPCTTPASPSPGGATRCPALAQGSDGVDDDGDGNVDDADESWLGAGGGAGRGYTRAAGAHDDVGALVFDSETSPDACPELLSSDGGIYYNTDNGGDCHNPDWEQPNVTPHAQWLFAMDGADRAGNAAEDLWFGLQDNGPFANNNIGAANPAASWHIDACCDVFDVATDGNRVLRSRCCGFRLELCDTAFTACTNISTGGSNPPGCCPAFLYPDFIQAIGDKQFVAATGNGLFLTSDITASPATWTEIGAASDPGGFCAVDVGVTGGTPTFYGMRGGCGPDAGNQVWQIVGTSGGTWTRVDNTDGLAGGFGVFAVDPTDPDRLYASYLGGGTNPQMVFSTDGGTNWEQDPELDSLMVGDPLLTGDPDFKYRTQRGRNHGVGNAVVNFNGYVQPSLLAFDPEDPDIVVAAGQDSGLFVSSNGGADWSLATDPESTSAAIPHLPRPRFAYFDHEPAGQTTVYVGTQGRGVWRVALANADLSIAKTDAPDPVVAGTTLTYTIQIDNDGPDPAGNVKMSDPLPAETTFESISAPGWTCETPAVGDPGTVTCMRASMGNGASSTITIEVMVDPATPAGTITDTATVVSNAVDGDQSDNSDTAQTQVVRESDFEIVSFDAVDPPSEILVGQDVEITLLKVITNHGPSYPEDAQLTTTATASPGATVTPGNLVINEVAVGLEELREVEETFTVSCQEASHHTFSFHNEIAPLDPATIDPDPTNNEADVVLDIECVVPVTINIKPRSFPNSINLRSTVPVAVLTTEAGEYGNPLAFDATTIDPLSVRFGPPDVVFDETGGAFERHHRGHIEDSFELDERTRDGDLDLVLHFRAAESGLAPGDTVACVKGSWEDGGGNVHKFFGCDSVRIVP